nr:MAG TPA: hypothetical protein [Caudoviricetes sp.]
MQQVCKKSAHICIDRVLRIVKKRLIFVHLHICAL